MILGNIERFASDFQLLEVDGDPIACVSPSSAPTLGLQLLQVVGALSQSRLLRRIVPVIEYKLITPAVS